MEGCTNERMENEEFAMNEFHSYGIWILDSRILRTVGILPGHPTGKPPSKQKGALRMTCSNRMALAISHDASLFPFLLPLFSGCSFSSGAPATGVDSARYSSSSFNFSLSFAK